MLQYKEYPLKKSEIYPMAYNEHLHLPIAEMTIQYNIMLLLYTFSRTPTCMALYSPNCTDVPLRNYSLTPVTCFQTHVMLSSMHMMTDANLSVVTTRPVVPRGLRAALRDGICHDFPCTAAGLQLLLAMLFAVSGVWNNLKWPAIF